MSHGQSRPVGPAPQVQWMCLAGRAATAPGGRKDAWGRRKEEAGSPHKLVRSAQWRHHLYHA